MSVKTFFGQAVKNVRSTAAFTPSSPHLARQMVAPLQKIGAKTVIEFGPGTGVMTRELLKQLGPDARILAFEINPEFVSYLRRRFPDPRLEVIAAGAETMGEELEKRGIERVDGVLSSLGLSWMPADLRESIFAGVVPYLHTGSIFTQYQYAHGIRRARLGKIELFDARLLLREYFGSIRRRLVFANLPPAYVYFCTV